ncbi:MAG: ATP-grasp domain-containing protein [Nitrospirae bacterium]|nr:ATP-grasp domain-containing protein [Nitrospirota bacterium]
MKIAVVHEQIIAGRPDSEDTLDELNVVTQALQNLGIKYETLTFGGGLKALDELLALLSAFSPDVVFNLVESHERGQRLFPAVCGLIELAGVPFTGSAYDALLSTTNKIIAKSMMKAAGIATPEWHVYYDGVIPSLRPGIPYIVKPSSEDASVGIDDTSVFYDHEKLLASLPETFGIHKQPLLIEEFIKGREINVSIIEHKDGELEVFPAAEIIFRDWPMDKPAIVNYDAKWLPQSFEYNNTLRRFNPEGIDIRDVRETALECWRVFGLRGYGRVDMRISDAGGLYVIEVNANPCISGDSGYMSAAAESGYSGTDVVRMIIEASLLTQNAQSGQAID